MFERWKKRHTPVGDVNIITKLILEALLFIFIIFVHNFDHMIYITLLMFIFLLSFNGTAFKVIAAFLPATILFALLSLLSMILYDDDTHMLFEWGTIHISTESVVRGLHLSLRAITVSIFGALVTLTLQIVMIFYSLIQHLKVKSKIAYASMAAIRMVPLIFTSFIQLRRSLKMRYQTVDASNYRGLKRIKHLLIPVLSQNIHRAHQLPVAMEPKGFKDGPCTYYYKAPSSYKNILFIGMTIALLTIVFYLSQYFPITGIKDARVSEMLE